MVGHSWGGHLALHVAMVLPERLLGVVAVDPLGSVGDGRWPEFDEEIFRRTPGLCAHGRASSTSQRGFLGSTHYEVRDDPDSLIEIAEWEPAEARAAHMEEAAATGAYAPLLEMLAVPFKATVIK